MNTVKQAFKRVAAVIMIAVMLVCSAPLDGFFNTSWSDFAVIAGAQENPHGAVVEIEVPDIEVIENYNGDWQDIYNEYGEVTGQYFHYSVDIWNIPNIRVTMADGTECTGWYYEIQAELGVELTIQADQSGENPWAVGEHQVTVTSGDCSAQFTVTVAENPVVSVTVADYEITEETGGYTNQGTYWDEESQTDISYSYYNYNLQYSDMKITVSLENGLTVSGDGDYIAQYFGVYPVINNGQSFENPWGIGKHKVEFSLLGVETEFNVEIVESPIKSITVSPIEIIVNTEGYWACDENGENEYYHYDFDLSDFYMTVELQDRTVSGSGIEVSEILGQGFNLDYNQSYENQWTVGSENTVSISVLGYTAECTVRILPSPIKSITVTPLEYKQNTGGYWANGEGDEDDYYVYSVSPYEVYMSVELENETIEGYGNRISEILDSELIIDVEQTPENPWGIGTYTAKVCVLGFVQEFEINIVQSNILSIELDDIEIIENTGGWYSYDGKYDPETGETTEEKWYYYSATVPETVTIYYRDETSETVRTDELGESVTMYMIQDVWNQWTAGNEYTVRYSYDGVSTTYKVRIVESPVVSLVVDPISIEEGTYCHETTGGYEDEETGEWIVTEYIYYDYASVPANVTLTLKDGTTFTGTSLWNLDDNTEYDIEFMDDQSSNPWSAGSTYTASITVLGKTIQFPVTITESPIKSITAKPIELIENMGGYFANHNYTDEETGEELSERFYYYYIDYSDIWLTVTMADGTVYEGDFYEIREIFDVDDFSLTSVQDYYNQWRVGEGPYNIKLGILGKRIDIPVTVAESPVESVEASTMYICKNKGGWTETVTITDEETGEEKEVEYYRYELGNGDVDVTIKFKDGRADVTGSLREILEGYDSYPEYETDQSYSNQWVSGEHTASVYVLGKKVDITVRFCDHANAEDYPEIAPDCEYSGYTAGSYCETCGYWIEGRESIEMTAHTDKNNDDICEVCGESISFKEFEKIFGRFLWMTGNGYDFEIGATPGDYLVFGYIGRTGELEPYYNSETWEYVVPYSEYMRLVDKHFVKHSDMMAFFEEMGMFTDETKTTLSWGSGGMGGPDAMKLLSVYDNGNGVYSLQGVYLSYDYYDMSLIGKDGYCQYEYTYKNEFGNIVTRIYPGKIWSAQEITVVKDGNDIKLDGSTDHNYYILNGRLFEFLDEGLAKYDSFKINCGNGAKVVTKNGTLEAQLKKFERNDSLWYDHGAGFGFDVEIEEGYELVSVKLKDNNGERELQEMSFGGYNIIPDGSAVLTVVTKKKVTHTHSYTSKVTKAATCAKEGVMTYTCTCGDSYTKPIAATGKHSKDNGTVTKKATYKSEGTRSFKCKVCGKAMGTEKLAKLTLGKVSGLKAGSVKTTSLKLSWSKVTGAQKYEIQQYKGGSWKTIKTTSGTSYTVKDLKAGTTYKFRVKAVRPDDKASGNYSSTLEVKTALATPKLTLKAGSKALTASWKSITGASGYEVQYSTSKSMKKAKTVKVNKSAKKTTIKKLKKGKKYYVRVRAYTTVNGKKVYSGWSTVKNVKVK